MNFPRFETKRADTIATACLTGVALVLVASTFADRWFLALTLCVVVLVAGYLTVIDLQVHRLPNVLTGPLALFATVGLGASGYIYDLAHRTPRALAFGVGLTILFFILHLVAKIGMGDVKYAYSVGFVTGWFGYTTLAAAFLVTTISAAAVGVVVLAITRDPRFKIAYGPYMSLGLVVALVTAT